jgi:hypothetical protein
MSKRLRFEIFKRDSFTCQYCGRSAPGVPICVDHIEAVVAGGSDDPSNLLTACVDCNAGKSDVPVSKDTLAELTERMKKKGTVNLNVPRPKRSPFPIEIKDWLSDAEIQCCSIGAKGLMVALLVIAHGRSRNGFLVDFDGSALTRERLFPIVGAVTNKDRVEYNALFDELIRVDVISVSKDRIMYSKRMVRDAEIQAVRRKSGSLGGKACGAARQKSHNA